MCETLLRFSPRVFVRTEASAGRTFFFLDLACNAGWIQRNFETGEVGLLEEAHRTLSQLGHYPARIKMAIADTAPAAQSLALAHFYWISQPGASASDLARLPLDFLGTLEGLNAWSQPSRVRAMGEFFSAMGFHTLGDLSAFTPSAFHERWGEVGDFVYRRLKAIEDLEPQPIPPYVPTEPLDFSVPLDFPVSLTSLLLHEVDTQLRKLFARLEGRRLVIRKLKVLLRCEYSGLEHRFEIEPSLPSRDRRFFMTLLENRLDRAFQNSTGTLDNPIRDIEFSVDPLPEKEQQAGFLDQSVADEQKLALLKSLLHQEGLNAGFPVLQDEVLPEKAWTLGDAALASKNAIEWSTVAESRGDLDETGFAPLTRYGVGLHLAPRPTLLLSTPRVISDVERSKLTFLSARPTERLEGSWWEQRAGPDANSVSERRDYYVARDPKGHHLWVFQDRENDRFYLHGAFD